MATANPLDPLAPPAAPAKDLSPLAPPAAPAKDLSAFTPVTPTITPFDESKGVAGRVDSIISKDSPLMQRAQTKALQQQNARGTLNSSMAIGAGQAAVIDAATSIVNADAGLYQQSNLANQQAQNQGDQFNAGLSVERDKLGEGSRQFGVSAGLEGKKLDQSADQFSSTLTEQARQYDTASLMDKAKLAQQQEQFTQGAINQKALAQMDADSRVALTKTEADYKTLIAGNENISNAWGTTMSSIDKIQNNPDLDEATKKTLINNTLDGFKSFTGFWQKATGGTVDVSNLLDFSVVNAGTAAPAPSAPGVPLTQQQQAIEAQRIANEQLAVSGGLG